MRSITGVTWRAMLRSSNGGSPLAPLPNVVPLTTLAQAVTPLLLLLWGQSFGRYPQKKRNEAFKKPRAELNPEGGALRGQKRAGAKPGDDHSDRNALLPCHFLLGMAQTKTGVIKPMMVATVSAEIHDRLKPV